MNGFSNGLSNLCILSNAKSRSISAENFSGEKGKGGMATEGTGKDCARELGQGWKVSPSIHIAAYKTVTLAEIKGPGSITHMWMTCSPEMWRELILRIYWDGEAAPSVECPLGDFFCSGWCEPCKVNSLPISVNPKGGFNSYFAMPFKKSAKITLENLGGDKHSFYYTINYSLTEIPDNTAYFHAQFNRTNPIRYMDDYVILDGVHGKGQYVGTYLAWQPHNVGWWGEGEIKMFLDGDTKFPTICGTGTEDYFGGAWCWDRADGVDEYDTYSTPFLGMHQVVKNDNHHRHVHRFGMYRFHVMDPIRFESDLRVTIQALGWRSEGRYLPLQDDVASVAYWYQTEPHHPFPPLPDKNALEVI